MPAFAADPLDVIIDAVAGKSYADNSTNNKVDVREGTVNNMLGQYDVVKPGIMTVEMPTLPEILILEEVTEEATA
ncbi:MAG: hypothetical protein R8N24_02630 [Alphaproteobacteria bacterium]|nr:hypothetical protein [Alphaproteobacteria bacterium]